MQKKFVLEIEYLFYSYVQVCLHVSTCRGVVRDVEEEQARRVLPDCSSHPTICLEVGVEIITWITHLEEKKSSLVATHDLFT
ncbi:hypothetical protein Peur_058262 [Populus x canadensis]